MKIIKCNLCGKKHSNRGTCCEDSVFVLQKNEVCSVAVADGAGSSKYVHAKQGADAVTKAVCEFLCDRFDDFYNALNELEIRKVIAAVCHKELKAEADKLSLDSYETMASTLLCVSVKGNKMIACHIGDGVIGCVSNGKIEAVTSPQNGEYASSTYFVNSPDAYQMIQVKKGFIYSASHIFLMTDGISEHVYNDATGEFSEALLDLVRLSEDENGSDLLKEKVQKCIVDTDEYSDDSTMAVIFLENSKSEEIIPFNILPEDKEKTESENIAHEDKKTVKKPLPYKAVSFVLAGILIVVLAILVAVLLSNPESPESTESNTLLTADTVYQTEIMAETNTLESAVETTVVETEKSVAKLTDVVTTKQSQTVLTTEKTTFAASTTSATVTTTTTAPSPVTETNVAETQTTIRSN